MEKQRTNRQKRALETKMKIIGAAKKVIAQKGFENISIEDIVKEAGVATGTFYTYFRRKEDVVEELSDTDFYRLAEIVNGMAGLDILQRIAYYSREFLTMIENGSIEICRQWLRNNLSPANMNIRGEEITKYNYDYRAMQAILAEAIKRGELKKDTPIDEFALFIHAELYGLMVAWCMSDAQVIGSEKTDAFCNKVLKTAIEPYRL